MRTREFVLRLNGILAAKDVTPAELAKRLGLTDRAVYHYLRGQRSLRVEDLPKFATALGLASAQDLLPEGW